jgi:hypothetical protein
VTVKEILKYLEGRDENEPLCAMLFEKSSFDFLPDDDLVLTDEGWQKLVDDFEGMAFRDVLQWLSDASIDYADITREEDDE